MSDYYKNSISVKDLMSEPGATGLLSDYKDNTDPKYIGPGTWSAIHKYAYKARTHERQLAFIEFMKDICYGFPCAVCKTHCTEYIKNHPMEDFLDIFVDINGEKIMLGMFVWSWKFHNTVNVRIKNPIMSWDTAYNLYSDIEPLVCSKNCLAAEDNQPRENNMITTSSVPKIPEFKITPIVPQTQSQPFRLISVNRR